MVGVGPLSGKPAAAARNLPQLDVDGITKVVVANCVKDEKGNPVKLPEEATNNLRAWLKELSLTADGIRPISRVHGYSGVWTVQNRFSLWHGIEIKLPDKASFDGKTLLYLPDDGETGVVCLTPENLGSPWLHFEAGALASRFAIAMSGGGQAGTTSSPPVKNQQSRAFTVLHDVKVAELKGPLSAYQATRTTKQEMNGLVELLAKALGKSTNESGPCYSRLRVGLSRFVD